MLSTVKKIPKIKESEHWDGVGGRKHWTCKNRKLMGAWRDSLVIKSADALAEDLDFLASTW